MNEILQDNKLSAAELQTPEGKAKRMEAMLWHLNLLRQIIEKPEDIIGFTFAIGTKEKMACGVFGPGDEINECLQELLNKANYVLSQE